MSVAALRVATGLLLFAGSAIAAELQPDGNHRPDSILVGTVVDGEEAGGIVILRDGDRFLIPLDGLAETLSVELHPNESSPALATPMGRIDLPPEALHRVDGILYLTSDYLRTEMKVEVGFDEAEYALRLDPPWTVVSDSGEVELAEVNPDVLAPSATLSGIRGMLTYTEWDDFRSTSAGVATHGRVARGLWRLWFENTEPGYFQVREYQWLTRRNKTFFLAGKERMLLEPVMGAFDLTGLQVGWSNEATRFVESPFGTRPFSPRRTQARETFRGTTTPGSFVRLRIDGRDLGSQQVGYDGLYEFADVPMANGRTSIVEVLVYAPGRLEVPTEVRRQRLATSDLLLHRGTAVHLGGAGYTGLFTQGAVGSAPGTPASPGGYYEWRQGLSNRFTAEAAVQYAGDKVQSSAGFVSRLARAWILAGNVAFTPGAVGYAMTVEGSLPRWRIFARSGSQPREFGMIAGKLDRYTHSIEAVYEAIPELSVGAVARDQNDGAIASRYVLPTLNWRPNPRLYLDARPDYYGEYLVNADWQINHRTSARFFSGDSATLELRHDVSQYWSTTGTVVVAPGVSPRYTAYANRYGRGAWPWSLRAGLIYTSGETGYLIGGNTPVLPGLFVRLDYQSIPFRSVEGTTGRLFASIVTDFSHASGRFVPMSNPNAYMHPDGSIVGRVLLDDGVREILKSRSGDGSLDGVEILINGSTRTRTDSGGRFFIGVVPEGFHQVELDPERLPIELTPLRTKLIVEVASGAATRVDFRVKLEFGIAGRVVDPYGQPRGGMLIDLIDSSGQVVDRAVSDRFGLYRLDGLAPGSYLVRAGTLDSEGNHEVAGERHVEVLDDFLFGQDIKTTIAGARKRAALGVQP